MPLELQVWLHERKLKTVKEVDETGDDYTPARKDMVNEESFQECQ